MPFQKMIDAMLAFPGVHAVSFLDSEGETILSGGNHPSENLKALGAYQGIIISSLQSMGLLTPKFFVTRFKGNCILTHSLKDGYFICLVLSQDQNYALLQHRLTDLYEQFELEL